MSFSQEFMTVFGILIIIILAGVLALYLSKRLRVSEILMLLIMAIILRLIASLDFFVQVNVSLLNSIVLVLASIYVFHYYQRSMELREAGYQRQVLKTIIGTVVLNALLVTPFFTLLFFKGWNANGLLAGLLFSIIVSAVEIGHLKYHEKYHGHKAIRFLNAESYFGPFFILVYGYTILSLLSRSTGQGILEDGMAGEGVKLFLASVIIGIGIGMIVSLVVFRIMRQFYSRIASPLFLLVMVVIAAMISQALGGDAAYAAIVMGMFYAKVRVKKKEQITPELQPFYDYLLIFLVIFLGLTISFPTEASVYWYSFLLFVLTLILRAIMVNVLWDSKERFRLSRKEKLFTSLITSRGPVACLLLFSVLAVPELPESLSVLAQAGFLVLLYSVVLSTLVISAFSRHLLEETEEY